MIEFLAETKEQWREWLKKNHKKQNNVFLIKYKKHTGKPYLTNRDAMDEALCFGWIDTTIKRIDDEQYGQTFVKRNKNSRWSRNTLSRAKRLIKEGRMTPEGLKIYKEGLKKPVIDLDLPKNPDTPDDLKTELEKKNLLDTFNTWAPSKRKIYIHMYVRAKREETKKKRIKEIIDLLK